ncbi:MAG: hypothetical protein JWN41_374 [Thermoleophilia bacterium]|nr:hypothetical protein [Thermoleophilia bacterium]
MTRTLDEQARERAQMKITQYLYEAHATELMIVQTLVAHISMTPAGEYRNVLESHLKETSEHAERIQKHLAKRDARRGVAQMGYGLVTGAIGQMLAVGKFPIDLVRGMSGEEKLLKNVRDECANESAEIATYLVIEQYAREVGDTATERLAASIRADEEHALQRMMELIPRLTADAVAADLDGSSQFELLRIGAVDGVRSVASSAARTVSRSANRAARASKAKGTSASKSRPAVTKPRASSSIAQGRKRAASTKRATNAKRATSAQRATNTNKAKSTTRRSSAR